MNRSLQIFSSSLIALVSLSASAQKPALVQNVDEKGRVPFQQSVRGTCSTSVAECYVFVNVPSGQRLVLTNVNAELRTSSTPSPILATLYTGLPLPSPAAVMSGQDLQGYVSYTFPATAVGPYESIVDRQITTFVDSGTALVSLSTYTADGSNLHAVYMNVTFAGYLIPIPSSATN